MKTTKPCPECGTPMDSVPTRRFDRFLYWCWKCERHRGPAPFNAKDEK